MEEWEAGGGQESKCQGHLKGEMGIVCGKRKEVVAAKVDFDIVFRRG